jgi:hypothetical protein
VAGSLVPPHAITANERRRVLVQPRRRHPVHGRKA